MAPPETRLSLIARLHSERDETAWRDFVTAYEPFLMRVVARHGVPEQHAADVTQQILLEIARSVESWKPDGRPASFRRWLSVISRHMVIRFMMRERRQAGGQGGTDWLRELGRIADPPSVDQLSLYRHELIVWAADQVRHEFQPSSWKAFQATMIEQKSVAEVADELNLSAGSIYMSRSRIIARIRRKIEDLDSQSSIMEHE